jgi:hypothetical protein
MRTLNNESRREILEKEVRKITELRLKAEELATYHSDKAYEMQTALRTGFFVGKEAMKDASRQDRAAGRMRREVQTLQYEIDNLVAEINRSPFNRN